MAQGKRPEDHGDYLFFRWFAMNGARLTVSCLFLIAVALVFYRDHEVVDFKSVLLFLGPVGGMALVLSLLAAMISYLLFKRRGGKVEKSEPPPGF